MLNLYRFTLMVHVVAGIIGLVAFWTPAIVRKGGALHVKAGRVFYKTTCTIALTGLVMAMLLLIDPLGVHPPRSAVSPEIAERIAAGIRLTVPFLVYLLLITFAPVHHGVRLLQTRRQHGDLRTPFHTAINIAAIGAAAAMIGLGIWAKQPVLAALSPIGFLVGFGQLGYARRPLASPMAWWYEHMGAMIGGGIAFHTAFLVLGANRLFHLPFSGAAAIIPWLLPTIIGIPASAIWVGYYKRKFREDQPIKAAPAIAAYGTQQTGERENA
jgi:hypothetical protein